MVSKITSGITVMVETKYLPSESNPSNRYYLFAYFITIRNHSDFPIRLISRHWKISDSSGEIRRVEGAGVVGLQPEILPGQEFTYDSACNLTTEVGKMSGQFLVWRMPNRESFYVEVPEFTMVTPNLLN